MLESLKWNDAKVILLVGTLRMTRVMKFELPTYEARANNFKWSMAYLGGTWGTRAIPRANHVLIDLPILELGTHTNNLTASS